MQIIAIGFIVMPAASSGREPGNVQRQSLKLPYAGWLPHERVCRRRLASDLARASEGTPVQGLSRIAARHANCRRHRLIRQRGRRTCRRSRVPSDHRPQIHRELSPMVDQIEMKEPKNLAIATLTATSALW